MSADFKPAAIKAAISFAAFDQVDIRVGTIISVEDVNGSDKLLKLTVDFGDHRRSILAGMKQERENPRALEGPAGFVCCQSRAQENDGRSLGRNDFRRRLCGWH